MMTINKDLKPYDIYRGIEQLPKESQYIAARNAVPVLEIVISRAKWPYKQAFESELRIINNWLSLQVASHFKGFDDMGSALKPVAELAKELDEKEAN